MSPQRVVISAIKTSFVYLSIINMNLVNLTRNFINTTTTILKSNGSLYKYLVSPVRRVNFSSISTVNKHNQNYLVQSRNSISPILSCNKLLIELKRSSHTPPTTYDMIREQILMVLRLYDKIDPEKLKLESHFYKDLGLDSLDHVEVIMAMEEEFQTEIPDCDAEKMLTPGDILKFFMNKYEAYPEFQEDHGHGHDAHH